MQLHVLAIAMFVLSLPVFKIITWTSKCSQFILDNEDQGCWRFVWRLAACVRMSKLALGSRLFPVTFCGIWTDIWTDEHNLQFHNTVQLCCNALKCIHLQGILYILHRRNNFINLKLFQNVSSHSRNVYISVLSIYWWWIPVARQLYRQSAWRARQQSYRYGYVVWHHCTVACRHEGDAACRKHQTGTCEEKWTPVVAVVGSAAATGKYERTIYAIH